MPASKRRKKTPKIVPRAKSKKAKPVSQKRSIAEFRRRSQAAKKGWIEREKRARKARLAEKRAAQKRSEAAARGWETRRLAAVAAQKKKSKGPKKKRAPGKPKSRPKGKGSAIGKKERSRLLQENERLRALAQAQAEELRATKKQAAEAIQGNVDRDKRFKKFLNLDTFPDRLITETAVEYAQRIGRIIREEGAYSVEESYRAVAQQVRLPIGEVYTLLIYVGVGEFAA